jgi:integrase
MSKTGKLDRIESYQNPSPQLFPYRGKQIWKVRYRRYLPDGTVERPVETLGDQDEFPTEASLRKSPKFKDFLDRINGSQAVVTFRDLTRLFIVDEIPKRTPHGQDTAMGHLKYLEDKWGEMRLDQLVQKEYDINNWLQGDLPKRANPSQQASRGLRRHLRTILVAMMKYAKSKHYLPYNPLAGTTLAVKKAGTPPVDRSEFFITPEQYQWMQGDPETPSHVKMMQQIAYTTGMRQSEFMALKWDEIDFDGPEPKIKIVRSVVGKHIRENTKTEHSKAPVPMCDRVAAALLYYKEAYPSVNGWLFGSAQTGRPLSGSEIQRDYHLPALWRMAAKFKLRGIPKGTGFHTYRHAYNALVGKVSKTSAEVKAIQMQLLRHGDKATNDRYGKSAQPVLDQARAVHTEVVEILMGRVN